MVENNPSDVKLDENPDGTVSFATDVVATIAGLAATEVEGVAQYVLAGLRAWPICFPARRPAISPRACASIWTDNQRDRGRHHRRRVRLSRARRGPRHSGKRQKRPSRP